MVQRRYQELASPSEGETSDGSRVVVQVSENFGRNWRHAATSNLPMNPSPNKGESMWIVKQALNRPYTFVVLAILILLVPLFESQSYLPQVVGHVVGSTQQNSQSVPGRIFGIVFLGHCVVPLQPFVRGQSCKLRE